MNSCGARGWHAQGVFERARQSRGNVTLEPLLSGFPSRRLRVHRPAREHENGADLHTWSHCSKRFGLKFTHCHSGCTPRHALTSPPSPPSASCPFPLADVLKECTSKCIPKGKKRFPGKRIWLIYMYSPLSGHLVPWAITHWGTLQIMMNPLSSSWMESSSHFRGKMFLTH